MMGLYPCLLLTTMLVYCVNCYPSGIGVNSACSNLTPGHGASAQNDAPPYYIEINATTVNPGGNVTVTLNAINTPFKGFMIQARRADGSSSEPLGTFVNTTQTRLACSGAALVHSSSVDKTMIQFNWTAPRTLDVDVIFRVTFVQSKLTFWVNVASSMLLVNKSRDNTTTGNSTAGTSTEDEYDDCSCFTRNTKKCDNVTRLCQCNDGWTGLNCTEDVDECVQVPNPCGDNVTCINLEGAHRCQCEDGAWLNASGQCEDIPAIKCHTLADIVLVIDSSGSIGSSNFQIVRSFVETLVVSLLSSSRDIRVGLILFDQRVEFDFGLNTYSTIEKIREAIQGMKYLGSGTRTDLALNYISDNNLFSEEAGGRPDAPDIVVIMTDGQSNHPSATKLAAEKLKKTGVKTMAVGITDSVDKEELEILASSPDYVLLVDDFSLLLNFLLPLVTKTCEAIKEGADSMPAPLGLCKGANFTNSVANLPYLGDCSKMIQCYYNQGSKTTLAVIRRCSPGTFWNPEKNDCVSSWTVQCPYDKCKNGSQLESFWDCSLL
ncbi:Cartilage matrix protein [Bulinus truncatus]|nr:Cartilage matrix protein [Bulinus truncatus]